MLFIVDIWCGHHKVSASLNLCDDSLLDDIEYLEWTLHSNEKVLADIAWPTLGLSFFREVELYFLLLTCVRSNLVLVAVHILCMHQRERAVWNLAKEVHCLSLGGDVGHDDFTLVWLVHNDVFSLIIIVRPVEKLVPMNHHQVVFYLTLAFFDLLFEENKIASRCDIDASLFVTLELVGLL